MNKKISYSIEKNKSPIRGVCPKNFEEAKQMFLKMSEEDVKSHFAIKKIEEISQIIAETTDERQAVFKF